jgi:hypothetical protein
MKTALAFLLIAWAGDSRDGVTRKLETKVSMDLRGVRLADAIDVFRQQTGINFVTIDGADLTVRLTVRDLSARSALRLLLAPADLGAAFENGVVVIRSRRNFAGSVVHRVYDVRSVLAKIPDFAGPRIELAERRGGVLVGLL